MKSNYLPGSGVDYVWMLSLAVESSTRGIELERPRLRGKLQPMEAINYEKQKERETGVVRFKNLYRIWRFFHRNKITNWSDFKQRGSDFDWRNVGVVTLRELDTLAIENGGKITGYPK
jgi:hypothetical protein